MLIKLINKKTNQEKTENHKLSVINSKRDHYIIYKYSLIIAVYNNFMLANLITQIKKNKYLW